MIDGDMDASIVQGAMTMQLLVSIGMYSHISQLDTPLSNGIHGRVVGIARWYDWMVGMLMNPHLGDPFFL